MIGKTISHYRIIEKLGEGGMGEVYLAEDTELKRQVALKFLPQGVASDEEALARFKREAQAAAALNHPNIITVHQIGHYEDQLFIAMAYIDGEMLRDVMERGVSEDRALDVAIQVCEGLDKAHQAGIVHRDIKPENILIDSDGRVKILDFGIATFDEQGTPTSEGSTVGTVYYMSPEQARGDAVDARSDIFSVGVILYELLTDRRPFKGDHASAVQYSILNENPEPVSQIKPGIRPELAPVVAKALSKDAADRHASAAELASDLRNAVAKAKPTKSSLTRIAMPGMLAALAIILLLVIDPFHWRGSSDEGAVAGENVLAIMYFENIAEQGDPGRLGEIITDLLITNLSQSEDLRVVSSQRLYDILKLQGKEGAKLIDRTTATEIAKQAGASRMMLGTILQVSPHLIVTCQLVDVATGNVEASQRLTGSPGETVFDVVDRMTGETRTELAVPVRLEIEQPKPIADVTTSSLEAYRHYVEGLEYDRRFYSEDACESFLKALEYDSTFAMAHYQYAWNALALQNFSAGIPALARAQQYADHVTEKERLYIEATSMLLTPRFENAITKLTEITEKYPDEKEAYWMMAVFQMGRSDYDGALENFRKVLALDPMHKETYNQMAYLYDTMGNFEKSIWAINQYIELVPDEANPYDSRADLYAFNGDVDNALASYQQALDIKPDLSRTTEKLGNMHLYKGEYDKAQTQYLKLIASDQPTVRSRGRVLPAATQLYQGHLRAALEALDVAIAADELEQVYAESYLRKLDLRRLIFVELGEPDRAHTEARRVFELSRQAFPMFPTLFDLNYAIACAYNGKTTEADSIVRLYDTVVDTLDDMSTQLYEAAKGLTELKKSNFEAAIRHFERADSLGPNDYLTRYGLAMSYMGGNRTHDAIALLEQVLERYDTSRLQYPVFAVRGHYLLGTAYQKVGETDKAIEQLRIFLEIWENADAELEEVSDAKERLEQLGANI